MDTSSKDLIPSRQTRAGRISPPPRESRGSEVVSSKAPSVRPSTGRLTLPVKERRIALRGQLTRVVASCCIARLVVLAAEDQRDPIIVHIDSPGGSIAEAMGILSTMNGIRCPVITFCRREALGPAAIIAAHGFRGYRAAAPGCRFCFKVSPGSNGRSSLNFDSLVPLLAEVLTKDARRRHEEVLAWLKNGAEFDAQQALAMGIIDTIASEPIFPKMTSGPAM